MSTGGSSSIGSTIAFSATLAASPKDQTAYEALTFVEWTEVTELGEVGGTREILTYTPVKTGIINKRSGPMDNGTVSLSAARVSGDAAQAIISTARDSGDIIACKETLATGEVFYYEAIVSAAPTAPGNASSITMINATLAVTGDIVEVAA